MFDPADPFFDEPSRTETRLVRPRPRIRAFVIVLLMIFAATCGVIAEMHQ